MNRALLRIDHRTKTGYSSGKHFPRIGSQADSHLLTNFELRKRIFESVAFNKNDGRVKDFKQNLTGLYGLSRNDAALGHNPV